MDDSIRSEGATATAHWPNPRVCVIRIVGELDLAAAPNVAVYLREQTQAGPDHLVIDLSQVRFLASAGVRLILSAAHNTDGIQGRLHLLGVTDNRLVSRVLDVCGVLGLLDIHTSLDELLGCLDHD